MKNRNIASPDEEFLCGVVERITYLSEESGYTIARLKIPQASNLTTIAGNFAHIQAGQTLQLQGKWTEHPKYGLQFSVSQYEETKPATINGIEKYLGSGLIKGVGKKTAKRIVAFFGLETLNVIENEIERLSEVPGIAKKRISQIQNAWTEQKAIKDVMIFLQGHGISTVYAVKIYKQYGDMAISEAGTGVIAQVTSDPYQLATDIHGIGFFSADKIAQNLGVSPWSKSRYRAGILHTLSESAEQGHCYLPESDIISSTVKLLSVLGHESDLMAVSAVADEMVDSKQLVVDSSNEEARLYYKPSFYHTEKNLAQLIKKRFTQSEVVEKARVESWLDKFTSSQNIELSSQQRLAAITAASEKMLILIGNPGTGKTFTTKTIVALWKAMGKKIALAAPTGRAAKRLSEMTGLEAKTLHRLLEFNPNTMGFKRDLNNPLDCSAVVIDEASMLDMFMAYSLFKALPPACNILIVGDRDQLPSVGAGNVLGDLIASGEITTVKLDRIFRQAARSAIITAAHQINKGVYPQLEPISSSATSDCLWHKGGNSPEQNVQTICDLIQHYIPQKGFNPAVDVQVLCPMTRGLVGTQNLNKVLQQTINPPSSFNFKTQLVFGSLIYRKGDRVMQLRNDYNREVFNGDIGYVKSINKADRELIVEIDGRDIKYDGADLLNLTLAWASSIHKSQGSEYPVVILPISTQHTIMLNRNLLYTGLTRGKKLVLVVGLQKAIALAVKQVKQLQRYTRLKERLQQV